MRLRGRRTCVECGEDWSYFETGDVACPGCGSLHSVARDEAPARHTVGHDELDLTAARAAAADEPLATVAALAADAARSFLAGRGFVDAGALQPLDDVTVAAAELRTVADRVRRSLAPDDDAEWYLLELLRGAPDGERPDVPAGWRAARGLAVATVVDRYRLAVARILDDGPDDSDARRALGTLRDHLRRLEALDGDVPVEASDRLLAAARDLGDYCRGDEGALARAEDRLSRV